MKVPQFIPGGDERPPVSSASRTTSVLPLVRPRASGVKAGALTLLLVLLLVLTGCGHHQQSGQAQAQTYDSVQALAYDAQKAGAPCLGQWQTVPSVQYQVMGCSPSYVVLTADNGEARALVGSMLSKGAGTGVNRYVILGTNWVVEVPDEYLSKVCQKMGGQVELVSD